MDNRTGCNPTAEERIIALIRSAKDPQRAMAIAVELITREVAAEMQGQARNTVVIRDGIHGKTISSEAGRRTVCAALSGGRMGFCMGFSKIRSFVKTPNRS